VKLPGEELIPCTNAGWHVVFTQYFFHGFSLLVHEFLCGHLFVYHVQHHHLSSNAIVHIACFISVCEYFLGIHPH
jgi:hypothetical protein